MLKEEYPLPGPPLTRSQIFLDSVSYGCIFTLCAYGYDIEIIDIKYYDIIDKCVSVCMVYIWKYTTELSSPLINPNWLDITAVLLYCNPYSLYFLSATNYTP